MPFEKGRQKTGGLKKGQKIEKTLAWAEFGEDIINKMMPRIQHIVEHGDDKQFLEAAGMFIEYFKPKLSRSEVTSNNTTIIQLDNLPKDQLKTLSDGLKPGE